MPFNVFLAYFRRTYTGPADSFNSENLETDEKSVTDNTIWTRIQTDVCKP